jgi:hypothetical protein
MASIRLQSLDFRASEIQTQSDPPNAGTKHLGRPISGAGEIFFAFGWLNRREGLGDGVRNGVERSGRSLSNEAFDLGEDLFDRIEVGRVFGKKQEASAGSLNGFPHGFSFMGAKIVEDDNVVGFESRDEDCST